jgi:hypothetical protein
MSCSAASADNGSTASAIACVLADKVSRENLQSPFSWPMMAKLTNRRVKQKFFLLFYIQLIFKKKKEL